MVDLAKIGEPRYVLGCPAQGLYAITLPESDLREWLQGEFEKWANSELPESLFLEGFGNLQHNLVEIYTRRLGAMISAASNDLRVQFEEYLRAANNLDLLILRSPLGISMRVQPPKDQAFLALVMTADARQIGNQRIDTMLAQSHALLVLSPAALVHTNLVEALGLKENASAGMEAVDGYLEESAKRTQESVAEWREFLALEHRASAVRSEEFNKWFVDRRSELEATRDIYHKHVQTEAAAIYWETKSRNASWIAWGALAAFVVLVVGALGVGFLNFGPIKAYVQDLASSSSTLSLTPIVVVTVPVLAYAWILRHISRVFIQNLTVADDAAYRRLMTMTFLGLTNDPQSGVTQAERAIILNALFRPAPPNTTEDGPPTGLLDIITKKA